MAQRLKEMYEELEEKVAQRTRELAEANQELVKVNRYKSKFLANMSHELRTPLTPILLFTEELLSHSNGKLTPEQAEYLGEIGESGSNLLNLINDLLDLSKIERGKMSLNLLQMTTRRFSSFCQVS